MDYIIIVAFLACLFLAYAGHRMIAVLLLVLLITFASWRFWDQRRANESLRSSSGDNLPDNRDSTGGTDGDFGESGGSGGGDGGGD
ncbi:MAG: hypothetical protein HZA92_20300 [Verrucomicrobia bacterium]|nr:hypothetical protein [Verrucomicrobiota bacterium]